MISSIKSTSLIIKLWLFPQKIKSLKSMSEKEIISKFSKLRLKKGIFKIFYNFYSRWWWNIVDNFDIESVNCVIT